MWTHQHQAAEQASLGSRLGGAGDGDGGAAGATAGMVAIFVKTFNDETSSVCGACWELRVVTVFLPRPNQASQATTGAEV